MVGSLVHDTLLVWVENKTECCQFAKALKIVVPSLQCLGADFKCLTAASDIFLNRKWNLSKPEEVPSFNFYLHKLLFGLAVFIIHQHGSGSWSCWHNIWSDISALLMPVISSHHTKPHQSQSHKWTRTKGRGRGGKRIRTNTSHTNNKYSTGKAYVYLIVLDRETENMRVTVRDKYGHTLSTLPIQSSNLGTTFFFPRVVIRHLVLQS